MILIVGANALYSPLIEINGGCPAEVARRQFGLTRARRRAVDSAGCRSRLPPLESALAPDAVAGRGRVAAARRRTRRAAFTAAIPIPSRRAGDASSHGAARTFCCAGCLGIAQTIHAAGLDAFYDRRDGGRRRARAANATTRDEWSRWDEAAAQAGLVRASGRRHARGFAAARRHSLRRLHLADRIVARAPAGRRAGERQLRDAARARRLGPGRRRGSPTSCARSPRSAIARIPYDPARREALARRESRALLLRLAVALLAMMQVMMFAVPTYVTVDGVEPAHRLLLEWASLTLTLPALLYSAAPFFRGAWRDLRLAAPRHGRAGRARARRRVRRQRVVDVARRRRRLLRLGDDVHRACCSARATSSSSRGGARATRSRRWRARDRRPRSACRRGRRGSDVETVGAASLAAGDLVLVRPGATVPADGEIVDGRAHVEEAILTGESRPRAVAPGDAVLAGSVVRDGALVVRVDGGGRGDATRGDRAARRARGGRAAAHRARRRSRRRVVRRRAARARGAARRSSGGSSIRRARWR